MMAKKLKIDLHTGVAFLIWAALLTLAYYKPNEQFGTYAIWLTTGLGTLTTKRLIQKRKEFNGQKSA
jgi:hypothetical protein